MNEDGYCENGTDGMTEDMNCFLENTIRNKKVPLRGFFFFFFFEILLMYFDIPLKTNKKARRTVRSLRRKAAVAELR